MHNTLDPEFISAEPQALGAVANNYGVQLPSFVDPNRQLKDSHVLARKFGPDVEHLQLNPRHLFFHRDKMLSRPTRLSISHPSPTTISFTVSNAFNRKALSAKFGLLIGIILRITLFVSLVLLITAKCRWIFMPEDEALLESGWRARVSVLKALREVWLELGVAKVAVRYADGMKGWVLAVGGLGVLKFVVRKWYTGSSCCAYFCAMSHYCSDTTNDLLSLQKRRFL